MYYYMLVYGPIACEQGDIVRVHARASPLARFASLVIRPCSNQPMDHHHIVWRSIT